MCVCVCVCVFVCLFVCLYVTKYRGKIKLEEFFFSHTRSCAYSMGIEAPLESLRLTLYAADLENSVCGCVCVCVCLFVCLFVCLCVCLCVTQYRGKIKLEEFFF